MNIWLMMLAIGGLTFLTRFSFIALLEKVELPPAFKQALRFVPIAALSAIVAGELVVYNDVMFISILNPRLLAGILASAVAYFTKNVIWTIVAGMLAFWLLNYFL